MRDRSADSFRQHLLEKYSLPPRAHAHVDKSANPALTRPLRELWEATDLSAAEFADEVSDHFGLPRLSLPQLLAATPRLDGFSRRFLRESTIFPFSASNDVLRLAVAAGPLLGLIGTVIGMIITFRAIVASGTSDPKIMARGIGQAMIATVLGLGIAIPLLFITTGLAALSRAVTQILDEQSQSLLAESVGERKQTSA